MKTDEVYLQEIYKKQEQVMNTKKKDDFYPIKKKEKKWSFIKLVATFVLTIGITFGIVYATNINKKNELVEKIWKEPKQYELGNQKVPLTEEEKTKCISEEEARMEGDKALERIGLEKDEILSIRLEKDYFSQKNEWHIGSNKASIILDAKTGELKSVQVPTWNYCIPYHYGITRQEAKKVARELLEKLRTEEEEGEYELVKLTRNMETDEASYIWYAQFYKKYGELSNPYEEIYIGWIPTINGIYTLNIKKGKYENNPEKITKEKAIEIAKQKDQQIEPNQDIKKIEAEIRIEQMNEEIYLRENFKEKYDRHEFNKFDGIQYQTEERVRKVWCVALEYDNMEKEEKYTYFVDCTTGEIIGGSRWNVFENEKIMKEDPYNFAL
ncbi:MAG: hypothetical protein HFJ33_07435 [Clostridia bacterium]|nr:hypothetical protein [Clostridia bacterium]